MNVWLVWEEAFDPCTAPILCSVWTTADGATTELGRLKSDPLVYQSDPRWIDEVTTDEPLPQ